MANLQVKRGDIGSGQIFINCTIEGFARTCFLDTGSNTSFVTLDRNTKLFEKVGEAKKSGVSGSKVQGDKVRVRSFKIGNHDIGTVELGRFEKVHHDLIGIDLLGKSNLAIDMIQKTLVISSKSTRFPYEFQRLPQGHLSLPLEFEQQKNLRIIFDTGAGLNSVDQAYVDKYPQYFEFVQEIDSGYDINNDPVVMNLYTVKCLKIGNFRLLNQTFLSFDFGDLRTYFDHSAPFILGFNGIDNHFWEFDLINKRFDVK